MDPPPLAVAEVPPVRDEDVKLGTQPVVPAVIHIDIAWQFRVHGGTKNGTILANANGHLCNEFPFLVESLAYLNLKT